MAKFYGPIGFGLTQETVPGVYRNSIIEKNFYGDVLINNRRLENSGNLNDNINVSNRISIVANPWAINNMYDIKYVIYKGKKWKVITVEDNYPRLLLTLGGLYVDTN